MPLRALRKDAPFDAILAILTRFRFGFGSDFRTERERLRLVADVEIILDCGNDEAERVVTCALASQVDHFKSRPENDNARSETGQYARATDARSRARHADDTGITASGRASERDGHQSDSVIAVRLLKRSKKARKQSTDLHIELLNSAFATLEAAVGSDDGRVKFTHDLLRRIEPRGSSFCHYKISSRLFDLHKSVGILR